MKELIFIRCYKCSNKTHMTLDTRDNISDLTCPKCKQKSMELDFGMPHKVIDMREQREERV